MAPISRKYKSRLYRISHDGVIKWKYFPCYWPFVRVIHTVKVQCRRSVSASIHRHQCFKWTAVTHIKWYGRWINIPQITYPDDVECSSEHFLDISSRICTICLVTVTIDIWFRWFPYDLFIHVPFTLQWRHNGRDSVSNHQPHYCLLNRLFRRRSKKTPKVLDTGLCAGNSPGTGEFLAQMASIAANVSIWWRHHDMFRWLAFGASLCRLRGKKLSQNTKVIVKHQTTNMKCLHNVFGCPACDIPLSAVKK